MRVHTKGFPIKTGAKETFGKIPRSSPFKENLPLNLSGPKDLN